MTKSGPPSDRDVHRLLIELYGGTSDDKANPRHWNVPGVSQYGHTLFIEWSSLRAFRMAADSVCAFRYGCVDRCPECQFTRIVEFIDRLLDVFEPKH